MTTALGRRLTEAHRLAQVRLGAQTVVRLNDVFPLLDPTDLDGTFPQWLRVATPIIQDQRDTSARLAATYLNAFQTLEAGADATIVLAAPASIEAVATSLLVTGPISLKKAASRGVRLSQALSIANAASSASGMRHALNGGRETITSSVRADRHAKGWQRVTSGKACDFCSLLAGRGAVYGEDTAHFQCHDGCSCSAEPVYR